MVRRRISRIVLGVAAFWSLHLSVPASAEVDLLFDPQVQTVSLDVDDLVLINLVAHSSDGTPQSITGIDAIVAWDPVVLELLGVDDKNAGYPWFVSGFLNDPDGINDGISDPPAGVPTNDGDAIYTALVEPGTPATAGPADLVVTTIQFRALQPTSATVVSFLPLLGEFGQTRVFGVGPQNDITGDISAIATVEIVKSSCLPDLDQDGQVGPFDLALLLGSWGLCQKPCMPGESADTCPADFDVNCDVGPFDLAVLLGVWGPCSE